MNTITVKVAEENADVGYCSITQTGVWNDGYSITWKIIAYSTDPKWRLSKIVRKITREDGSVRQEEVGSLGNYQVFTKQNPYIISTDTEPFADPPEYGEYIFYFAPRDIRVEVNLHTERPFPAAIDPEIKVNDLIYDEQIPNNAMEIKATEIKDGHLIISTTAPVDSEGFKCKVLESSYRLYPNIINHEAVLYFTEARDVAYIKIPLDILFPQEESFVRLTVYFTYSRYTNLILRRDANDSEQQGWIIRSRDGKTILRDA